MYDPIRRFCKNRFLHDNERSFLCENFNKFIHTALLWNDRKKLSKLVVCCFWRFTFLVFKNVILVFKNVILVFKNVILV